MFETLRQDLRHGARMLVKNPGFAAIAIVSIAIGVGANAAMFSLGLAASIATGGLLRGVFVGQGTIDVTTYALVVSALVAVTLLAACVPARRAAAVDPVDALRAE